MVEADIKLQPWETIIFDTTPHSHYFLKLKIAYILTTLLWICLLIIAALGITLTTTKFVGGVETTVINNPILWWLVIVVSLLISGIVYVFTESMLRQHRTMIILSHGWIFLLILILSIVLIQIIQIEVQASYPREWWEEFLGLPFTLASIVFCVIVLLISSILWKIASIAPDIYSFPLQTASLTLIAVSIYGLLFPIQTLSQPLVINTLLLIFCIVIIVYGILLLLFINYRGGMRFVITNRRVFAINTFLGKKTEEYFYERIQEADVHQGVVGKKYDFGDITFIAITTIMSATGPKNVRRKFTIYGTRSPVLVKNAILALSRLPIMPAPVPRATPVTRAMPKPSLAIPPKHEPPPEPPPPPPPEPEPEPEVRMEEEKELKQVWSEESAFIPAEKIEQLEAEVRKTRKKRRRRK
jgi:hypothetical protein